MNKTCIIIAGPTASGKTSIAIELAKYFKTSIISADSRQCYKEMNIGVAKPSPAELKNVPHYFINSHTIQQEVNAVVFEQYALACIDDIFRNNEVTIMAGGTGLYMKAFCEGLDQIPLIEQKYKTWVNDGFNNGGLEWLQEQVRKYDPVFNSEGETKNPRRMMRALEVIRSTGISIIAFQKKTRINRPFHIIKYGLHWPRDILYNRINERVDKMIWEGLEAEARELYPMRNLKALQTVGYQELFQHFDGKLSLQEAITLIKQNTRHYSKRQMTWFKKDKDIIWLDAMEPNKTASTIIQAVARQ